ncbi:phosphoribosylglycinamide formyltransferase [Gonapodya prolifera JEL478]|uniref:phosphoribosylglycinamide formyltransferase 1 n=1 Tax=Gonapodya prolifera (strain JEL478) TaxID=1344416 RepID=A0A139AI44_GONPJ|nr:phosphoribosylglycinamide formyltransferase [Gonapodya prolifera JEL478]|eukprot:KXS16486.1 phosphoribosylglycinamide formyltransferase [Gonapodya prolifera JEL478]
MASHSRKPRIVVLISGNGSNLQAIINASSHSPPSDSSHPSLPADIALVVSNRSKAFGLERAAKAGIPTLVFTLKPFKDQGKTREDYDDELGRKIATEYSPDLVMLAGWMHILSPRFLAHFAEGTMLNLHPALPGEFDGAEAIERAYAEFKEGKISRTGVMVHKVVPEVDRGEVVCKREVPILPGDTLRDLQTRIHDTEHGLIVEGIRKRLQDLGFTMS